MYINHPDGQTDESLQKESGSWSCCTRHCHLVCSSPQQQLCGTPLVHQDLSAATQLPRSRPLLHWPLQRPLAWCSGTAGVVNQAVANKRTATSQHQGHTALQAASIRTPERLDTSLCNSLPHPQVLSGLLISCPDGAAGAAVYCCTHSSASEERTTPGMSAFCEGQRKQVSQGEGRCSQVLREAEHPQLNVSLESLETHGG